MASETAPTGMTTEELRVRGVAGTRVRVIVSAVDQNYYDYYSTQSDPFAGPAPGHLAGAVGVFGSIAPIVSLQLTVR